jgi:hypothetical protein
MKVIESWDIDANFWEANIQFKAIMPFKKVFDADKSKHKVDSSRLMWGLSYLLDFDSKYRQLPFEERKSLIAKDIFNKSDFDWSTVNELITSWDMFKSVAQRQLMEWERFMNEKTVFMSNLKFDNFETGKEIEKLLLSNTALYEAYEKIKAKLAQEDDSVILKGGARESILESGEI